ncbi:hypothetical protein GALMADRAFT_57506 [Galerina marginata CBS 339.88]|uniref:U4/U6 snRNA-associated-splicing factor PRP24 n=1 Tax=Galerina marginata (strain CBS 339.88) TaxID=685588 RepID=A0A067TUN0_GALM3|nr:hypothetical protein GALMADRAFT_57506 [Galerina marginata CBS 339.88]
MNEAESLDALANILGVVAEKPYDVSAHAQHIHLAQSLDAGAHDAMEMMTQFMAAGDEVWLPLLQSKEQSVDLETEEGIEELLALYNFAENDYFSIPILQKHLKFLIERYALYTSGEHLRPEALGDIFTPAWTREAINGVVKKGVCHLTQARPHKIWDAQRDWEIEVLETAPRSEKQDLVEHVQQLHLDRLRQPHPNIEDTFQSYSSFTTNYLPAQNYETILVSASKIRAQSIRNLDRREKLETAITQSGGALEAYNQYIGYERRARYPDLFVTRGIYERAIAEAAKRRFAGEVGAEEALRMFWASYCDAMRILDSGLDIELETYRRAVRSVPGSGEIWARYIRFLERVFASEDVPEGLETIPEIFNRAVDAKVVQTDIEQLAPLVLARAGYEKRLLEAGNEDENVLPTLIGVLESGMEMAHRASKSIDPKLRLEKFLASIYENVGLLDSVFEVWKATAKHSKSNYQVWLNYTDTLIKHKKFDEARQVFTDIHSKQLDWPEALWEAWLSFEHLHGSVEDIENASDKIESAQYQTNMRRSKEAAKAAYQNMQITAEAQANVPVATAPVPDVQMTVTSVEAPMDIDEIQSERGTKRGAEEETPSESHKKARIEQKPPPLKRDRENSTVFVADLPKGVTDGDLQTLFKDCGRVREVKITQLPLAIVATVEFFDRDNVPAALTKDKKRIHDQEISVHLAWRSTLYVTNFPESADDPFTRDLFGKYGTIFDIRWPSKKFKNTRRFCYVQYTSPDSAQSALELHGRELEPGLALNVYISNPERKKERTDQDANEKEVYVAGLSRFTTKADLEKLFSTYGPVKDVRIALEDNGHAKGFAFVEFEEAKDAQTSLAANNHELKKRRIAVTLADPRVRARHKSEIGISRVAEARNRSVRVKNLPPATQEGLLQQVLEKIAPVKRVEVFLDKQEAIVELENPADAGRLLLRTEPVVFGGNTLELSENVPMTRASGASQQSEGSALFKPRRLGPSKPKAGLGFKKSTPTTQMEGQPSYAPAASSSGAKGQDDFRKMLNKK